MIWILIHALLLLLKSKLQRAALTVAQEILLMENAMAQPSAQSLLPILVFPPV
jgi:hypothetical protein